MKVSVNSTFSYIKFNLNYGSALQCYALQRYLSARGHVVSHVQDYRANPKYILTRIANIKYGKAFLEKAKAQIALQRFIKKNIALSERAYFSYSGLVKHCPEADCHIAGSDQIWHNANNFRYLTYVPDEKLKLSYAASFGAAQISDSMKNVIKPYLKRFDGITVREKSGVSIINSMGYPAEHVLDPTLLLDCGAYPCEKPKEENYCYCYFLNLSQKEDVAFAQIEAYSEKMRKKLLVTVPQNYPMFLQENLLFPSVEEWLGLYKNADCIFTNTYHGLLFCIIFQKQFLFFAQKGETTAENERHLSLLTKLELLERVVTDKGANEILEKMHQPIDYDRIYKIIREERLVTDQFFAKFGL